MARTCCVTHVVDLLRRVTVEPVLFLFMFASSLTFSAFMAMTYDKSCLALFNDTWCAVLKANKSAARQNDEDNDAIQSLSSAWMMRSNIATTVLAMASLLLWLGSWGDRVGRRLPLVLPCVAAMVYSISNVLNATFMHAALIYTLIGPIFNGLGGSYLAVLMAGYTYLTDLSESGNRMKRVGVAESAVYLSSTVSVFVSGLLVDRLGYVPTFAIALGCQALALLYTLILLPEIRTRDTTPNTPSTSTGDSVRCCQGACLDPLRDMWRFVRAARATRVKVHLALFIVVLDILQLCTTGENDILLLYLKHSPRNWTYTMYGYFKGAENFTRGMAVLVLLPLLKKMASPRDTTLILAGLVSKMAGLILLGLAKETWTIFLMVAVACLQGFPSAGIRSLLSSLVFKDEQGRLFGVVASTEGLVSFLSTLIFNGVYPRTLTLYDGLCFLLAACLVFVCLVIIMFQHIDLKASERSFETVPEAASTGAVSDTSSQMATQHSSQSFVDHSSLGSADVSSNAASGASPSTNDTQ